MSSRLDRRSGGLEEGFAIPGANVGLLRRCAVQRLGSLTNDYQKNTGLPAGAPFQISVTVSLRG
jgi:hypothetical protein